MSKANKRSKRQALIDKAQKDLDKFDYLMSTRQGKPEQFEKWCIGVAQWTLEAIRSELV